jgi:hypothetical protein
MDDSNAPVVEMLDGPPLAWHLDAPDPWTSLSPTEHKRRSLLTSDQCVIDDQHFFVRGLIEIPVLDGDVLPGRRTFELGEGRT